MQYFIEFKEKDELYTWEVEIDGEPKLEIDLPNYKYCTPGIVSHLKSSKITLKFLENIDETNIYRRELLFEKRITMARKLRKDSDFIISLTRIHLFLENRVQVYGDPFSHIALRLFGVQEDGLIVSKWLLTNVCIVDSSFYLNPAITNVENQTITIQPESFWRLT